MAGLFVTATGTDVGKTYVSAGLIRAARRAGHAVGALKPVVTGFDEDNPSSSDTAALIEALGAPQEHATVEAVSPWRFKAPLSPDMAAALEGRKLSFGAIVAACREATAPGRFAIVEGAGGVMVPLDGARTLRDLMHALALPIVLVSPTGLGSISHLLTAVEALKAMTLAPAAVILNEIAPTTVPLALTRATLERFLPPETLFLLTGTGEPHDAVFDRLFARLASDDESLEHSCAAPD